MTDDAAKGRPGRMADRGPAHMNKIRMVEVSIGERIRAVQAKHFTQGRAAKVTLPPFPDFGKKEDDRK